MPIRSYEMTADPNQLKLNLTGETGFTGAYSQEERQGCQAPLDGLLDIEGVMGIEVGQMYVSLTRDPLVDWDTILDDARKIIG